MIAEWERELGISLASGDVAPTAPSVTGKKLDKAAVGGDLLGLVHDWEFYKKSEPEAARLFLEKVGHPVKTQTILDAILLLRDHLIHLFNGIQAGAGGHMGSRIGALTLEPLLALFRQLGT